VTHSIFDRVEQSPRKENSWKNHAKVVTQKKHIEQIENYLMHDLTLKEREIIAQLPPRQSMITTSHTL